MKYDFFIGIIIYQKYMFLCGIILRSNWSTECVVSKEFGRRSQLHTKGNNQLGKTPN